jgi:hypothetical protein
MRCGGVPFGETKICHVPRANAGSTVARCSWTASDAAAIGSSVTIGASRNGQE